MLSPKCYMFGHQVAILREFTNNRVSRTSVSIGLHFYHYYFKKLVTNDLKMLKFYITIVHKHIPYCSNTNNHEPVPEGVQY